MVIVVNFSHPLPEGRPDVESILGDEYQVHQIPVQVDRNRLLPDQVEMIYQAAIEAVGGNSRDIDVIILPGLAEVAVLLVGRFARSGYKPHVLRLAPIQGAVPPRYEAAELIKSYLL